MQQYFIMAWDGTDEEAGPRRLSVRPAHFENARKLKDQGQFIFGGAILDHLDQMTGSVMVMQFESDDLLQDWLRTEPYIAGGVWQKIEVHPFRVANV